MWELAVNLATYWSDEDKSNGRYHGLPEPLPGALMAVACELGNYSCVKNSFARFKMCAEIGVCRMLEQEIYFEGDSSMAESLFEQTKQDIYQALNSGDYRQINLPSK